MALLAICMYSLGCPHRLVVLDYLWKPLRQEEHFNNLAVAKSINECQNLFWVPFRLPTSRLSLTAWLHENPNFRRCLHFFYWMFVKNLAWGTGHIYNLCNLPRSWLPLTEFCPVWPGYENPKKILLFSRHFSKMFANCFFLSKYVPKLCHKLLKVSQIQNEQGKKVCKTTAFRCYQRFS